MSPFRSHNMKSRFLRGLRRSPRTNLAGTRKMTTGEYRLVWFLCMTHMVLWVAAWIVLVVWFRKSPIIWIGGVVLALFIPSGYYGSYRKYDQAWMSENAIAGKSNL